MVQAGASDVKSCTKKEDGLGVYFWMGFFLPQPWGGFSAPRHPPCSSGARWDGCPGDAFSPWTDSAAPSHPAMGF